MVFAWHLFSSRASSSTQQAERALWEIRRPNIILPSQYQCNSIKQDQFHIADLPQGSIETKVDQLWFILPTQNFDMDYQVPHQHESPSASAQWLQFQEVWVYPFNELKYLLGVFHWSLVFQGTFCCNSWSYSSTWSLMWSSRLTHRWENRIHCTFI